MAAPRTDILLISPSGRVRDPAAVTRACERLTALGFRTRASRHALASDTRFAGTDAQRLSDLHAATRGSHRIVMATRGGYGLTRLLPQIDWVRLAESGKRFVGYSDITALHLGLLATTGATSWAGPAACQDFGGDKVDELTVEVFAEAMNDELEILSFASKDADPVDARGILWGGNLSIVCALLGTPWFPKVKGGILFLEDVGEHPYRIERMLVQLHQAGVLSRQKAIVLGGFTGYRLTAHDAGYDLPAVWTWLRRTVKVPVITGLPFSHGSTRITLPVGQRIGIAHEDGLVHLVFEEHA
jgi:muramoyltetrapeptide carboxypeptidase